MPVGASFWHSDWKGWSYGLEREARRCIHPHLQISLQQIYLVRCFYSLFWWKVLETDGWVMKGQAFSWIHLPLWKAKWKVYLLERPLGHFTALPFVSIVGTEQALKASCNDFPFSKRWEWAAPKSRLQGKLWLQQALYSVQSRHGTEACSNGSFVLGF